MRIFSDFDRTTEVKNLIMDQLADFDGIEIELNPEFTSFIGVSPKSYKKVLALTSEKGCGHEIIRL